MLRTRRSRLAITALVAITLTSFGCASTGGPNPAICATVGAVLGGGAGVAIADGHEHDRDDIRGGAAGAVVLGTAGYFICRALAQEPPPPPPPEPPPPPAPRVVPEPPVQRIVLRGVNFDFDKSAIRSDAAVILDEAVRLLAGGSQSVLIEGHTDWTGPDAYNQGLSERRAESVRSYLVEHGIAPGRLRTQGFGESQPIASNETRDGRALNRRVELEVQN